MDTKSREKMRGLILASLASSLWSISGISGEILFKKYNFSFRLASFHKNSDFRNITIFNCNFC